jgi:hypothetical protein
MKKNLVLPVLLGSLLAVMMLGGCVSWPPVGIVAIDETVPETDTAVIYFYDPGNITLKTIDGEPIPQKLGSYHLAIRVPAGEHTFIGDGRWPIPGWHTKDGNNIYFREKDVQFTYDFKADVSYLLHTEMIGGEGADVVLPPLVGGFTGPKRVGGEPFIAMVKIYAVTEYNEPTLQPVFSKDNLIEMIRFDQEVSF